MKKKQTVLPSFVMAETDSPETDLIESSKLDYTRNDLFNILRQMEIRKNTALRLADIAATGWALAMKASGYAKP
jgi:hypothetical protein